MIQEDDVMKMKNSFNKKNKNLNSKENKQFRLCLKFAFSILFSIIIFLIFAIN